ncbi:MAG: hypothetical protein KOO62_09230 [candidate division Zixibacteria bacterium]|nr:hypothetical protein [candidate division Zixibacteria bacterium]
MQKQLIISVVVILMLCGSTILGGAAPQLLNYQAVLLDGSGDPVTTEVSVKFAIYDAASDGTELWTETSTITPNDDGAFDHILGQEVKGSIGDLVFAGPDRWLGITVGADAELSPRTRLVSSAYSMRVSTVDQSTAGELFGSMKLSSSAKAVASLTIAGSGSDSIYFNSSSGTILSATNGDGYEVVNFNTNGDNNSALFVVRGPGGDEETVFSSGGMNVSAETSTRAMENVVSLTKDGFIMNDSDNPADELVRITRTTDGAELVFNQVSKGGFELSVPIMAISEKGVLIFDPATAETLAVLDNAGSLVQSNSDGDMAEHSSTGSSYYYDDGLKVSQMSVSVSADGITVFSKDNPGDPAVEIKYNDNRSEIILSQPNKASSPSFVLTDAGLYAMENGGADTNLFFSASGNIISNGQIAVGEGCNWGAAKDDPTWSVVFGFGNTASGDSSTVSGGYNNVASARISTISGGANNTASGKASVVGGGYSNTATKRYTTVGGGVANLVDSSYSVIAGGYMDTCHGTICVIGGGLSNKIDYATVSFIGGGQDNTIKDTAGSGWLSGATIAGGSSNFVTASYGTVCGGNGNLAGPVAFVGGGSDNHATGGRSGVVSGWHARARGNLSLATGFGAKANHDGSTVLSAVHSSTESDSVMSNGIGQMVIRAQGGMYITNVGGLATATDGTKLIQTNTGASLTTGGVWTNFTPPKSRGQRTPVDGHKVLGLLDQLPIERWTEEPNGSTVHVSPSAEEFNHLFGVGTDDESLASLDLSGIALAAIKELNQKMQEQQLLATELQQSIQEQQLLATELKDKDLRIEQLEMRLTQMEAMMETILATRNGTDNNGQDLAISQ